MDSPDSPDATPADEFCGVKDDIQLFFHRHPSLEKCLQTWNTIDIEFDSTFPDYDIAEMKNTFPDGIEFDQFKGVFLQHEPATWCKKQLPREGWYIQFSKV